MHKWPRSPAANVRTEVVVVQPAKVDGGLVGKNGRIESPTEIVSLISVLVSKHKEEQLNE